MPLKKTVPQPAPEHQSYLQRLQFDPRLMTSTVSKYINNIRIVILLGITISLLGVMSYLNLPKRLNPEVKIPIVLVNTVLPGAGPSDVESLLSIPLENQLRSVKGLDTITSVSHENVSTISLLFLSTVNQDNAKKDVQSIVDSFTDLPENSKKPVVTALDFEDQPIWTFTITGSGDVHSLMAFSEVLKKKIADVSKVDRVVASGFEDQEVLVTADPEKVQQLGINPVLLAQTLRTSLASYPAGTVTTSQNSFSLTIDPSITQVKDIRNMVITIQGHTFTLGDIATVQERSKIDRPITYFATKNVMPQRSVTLSVYKTTSSNIDEAGKQVKTVIDQALADYHNQFTITTLVNTSEEITKQFNDLLKEFRSTILLVFLCLFVFLGLRQALISSFTVPLTFLSAFFFMQFFGMTINFLSLFAFLLALGLLVDDTIVTVQAMTTYYRTGKFTPLQTGLLVWRDTIVPIWSTTITTIWSFVPLLLSTGIIGEFIKPIPIVVTITMISSTAIAVLITLPVMIVILKPNLPDRTQLLLKLFVFLVLGAFLIIFFKQNPLFPLIGILYIAVLFVFYQVFPVLKTRISQWKGMNRVSAVASQYIDHGVIHIEGFSQWYYRTITKILNSKTAQRKVILAIAIYAVFSFALLPLGFVTNEFFPKTDQNLFYINIDYPSGTTLQNTEKLVQPVLNYVRSSQLADFVTAEVGRSQSASAGNTAPNSVVLTVHLPPKEARTISSQTLAQNIRTHFSQYQLGTLTVIESTGGPPAGSDVQIKLLGSDLGTLNTYADKVVAHLKQQPGVTNVQKSILSGTSRLVFHPDYAKMSDSGVSVDTIGLWMRIYGSGFQLNSINFDKTRADKEDVVFKLGNKAPDVAGIGTIQVVNQTGVSYPLLSLGTVSTETNPTVITREGGSRTISVSASVTKGFAAPKINTELQTFTTNLHMASGYSWKTGGANEENQKSVTSILQAMGVAFILILITMVIQFGSFRQAVIVLIVIPLAVSSVFLIFAITGTPLSFPALIGVLSLFGIVVTNSMFIVDKININRHQGMKLKEAIADAGASRLEPIILTKLCTVFGLLPITLSDPLWRGLGGAIISGLLISSTIMLLFIPTLYYMWFKNTEKE